MMDMALQLALAVIPVVLAITLHEAAHGYAALALGDDTARLAGRLSLNPLRHVDRFGTILLPGFLLISQLLISPLLTTSHAPFLFGWAKPVPIGTWNFRYPRQEMAIVAAAGPAMNFLLAWLAALSLHAIDLLPPDGAVIGHALIDYFIQVNLLLGLFNLLPIPPLDGGRVLVGILPEAAALRWARLERAGIVIVVLVVFILPRLMAEFGIQFDPVLRTLVPILIWAYDLVLHLADYHGSE